MNQAMSLDDLTEPKVRAASLQLEQLKDKIPGVYEGLVELAASLREENIEMFKLKAAQQVWSLTECCRVTFFITYFPVVGVWSEVFFLLLRKGTRAATLTKLVAVKTSCLFFDNFKLNFP